MALLGMNVDAAENVYNRLRSSKYRGDLMTASARLRTMINKTHHPEGFGIQPGERVLTAYSVSQAQHAITSISGAIASLDSNVAILRSEIDSQATKSAAATAINSILVPAFGIFLPSPKWVRVYEMSNGTTRYGAFFRSANDPRRLWANQDYKLSFANVSPSTARFPSWWRNSVLSTFQRGGDRFVDRVSNGIKNSITNGSVYTHLNGRFPNGVSTVVKGGRTVLRALGPIGNVVGFVFAYGDGMDQQREIDQDSNYSDVEKEARANVRGTAVAVGSTVGAIAGAAVGAAIGGPFGAILGGFLGGLAGEAIGGFIADQINK